MTDMDIDEVDTTNKENNTMQKNNENKRITKYAMG